MDTYDSSTQLSEEDRSGSDENITRIINALFSHNNRERKHILDQYYFPDATYISPIIRTEGIHNINHVLLVWQAFNKDPPAIENICFSEQTCVVFQTQTIRPRFFPWLRIHLPITVVLEFKETTDDNKREIIKIHAHHEHWTIEGILESIPILSFWYNQVVRAMLGKVLSVAGEAVYTATETAHLLASRNKELAEARQTLEARRCHNTQEDGSTQVLMLHFDTSSTT
ncbi:hypothetical protein K501DRAFT_338763 [Backusella circina FSU 941]|nr:hypothetical protein K501DRAFT_338763 [Backusella circina FSU 941]